MKNYQIKDLLKKEILIVEIATGLSQIRKNTLSVLKHDGYILLGSPDEIREDDARELVEETEMGVKLNSKKYKYRAYDSQLGYATATESLLSAIESEIYWENPIPPFAKQGEEISAKWYEAESRTFDRNRTLIFVKN